MTAEATVTGLVDPDPDLSWFAAWATQQYDLGIDPCPEWDGSIDEPWRYSDASLVEELDRLGRQLARLKARWLALVAEAERRDACSQATGFTTAGWLVDARSHSPRTARHEVALATGLESQPTVKDALGRGDLSVEQAAVIVSGLQRLPAELTPAQQEAVAATLVGYAAEFGPVPLRRLVNRAVEVVAPEIAEAADRAAVERADREQRRSRHLSWWREDDGGLHLAGRLPAVAGEQLVTLVSAIAAGRLRSAALAGEAVSFGQACADALATIVEQYSATGRAPAAGGDRPRVVVTLSYQTLLSGLGPASLLGNGERITPGEARRLACDAGILPVVLGGASQPLDVGREQRLFSGALRQAVLLRDGGCAFPTCDRGPADCDLHHLRPWWAGGETKLSNAVALCVRHHHLVEPNPTAPPGGQWEVHLDPHGNPAFLAPARPGQTRRVERQHHRFRT